MGKTKTVLITGGADGPKTGKAAYEEKKRRQLEAQKKADAATGIKEKAKLAGLGLKGGERIKIVGSDLPETDIATDLDSEKTTSTKVSERKRKDKVRSKKYKEAKSHLDRSKFYSPKEAVDAVKKSSYSKFDGTMELHMVVRKLGLSLQTTLPHSTGKVKKVEIANDATIENLKKGKVNFEILLATAEMMPKLVPFAKILGPRGLMPNPKNGTLIKSEKEAAKFSGNNISLKTEKSQPVIHTVIGKVSQNDKELLDNIEAVIETISKKQILKAYLTSTMGPSVKLGF